MIYVIEFVSAGNLMGNEVDVVNHWLVGLWTHQNVDRGGLGRNKKIPVPIPM